MNDWEPRGPEDMALPVHAGMRLFFLIIPPCVIIGWCMSYL